MKQTGDKQSTRKRIYNNGYKDAQWSQEKNKLSENFNKGIENIKNNQSELKSTITKMKNTLEVINRKLDDAIE